VLFTLLMPLLALSLAGCFAFPARGDLLAVTINADGASQTIQIGAEATVSDALRRAGLTLRELDRVNPPGFNRIVNGMTITVVRVDEKTEVVEEPIPFERRTTLNDGLAPGESRLLQAGINGVAEVTVRIIYEDGVEVTRSEIRRVLIRPAQDEIVMVGSRSDLPTVTVRGTLAYISSGNAWVMTQNSANRRPLTLDGGLDGRVFRLSPDGRMLLFTRAITEDVPQLSVPSTPTVESSDIELSPEAESTPQPDSTPAGQGGEDFNALWIIPDITDPESQPVRLDRNNILYADWVPGREMVILYSTAEPRPGFPGWQANNDLWRARVSVSGATTDRMLLLQPSSGGVYGWFGTFFELAPDGLSLAWAQPDAVGVLLPVYGEGAETSPVSSGSQSSGELPSAYVSQTLARFAPRNPYDFVWVPSLSWAPDGLVFATTTHADPVGAEAPEDSEAYDVTALPYQGGYQVTMITRAGMWASPRFSPLLSDQEPPTNVALAYLQATDPLNSLVSRYELVIADRDGSNAHTVFPSPGQPGMLPGDQDYVWAPDGRQIALTYQGNLYLVDITARVAQQLTSDGLTSSPRWRP